jgi:hypothetical protein
MWNIARETGEVTSAEVDRVVDRTGANSAGYDVEVKQRAGGVRFNHPWFSPASLESKNQGAHIPGAVGFVEDSLGPLGIVNPRALVVALDIDRRSPFGEEAAGRKV